MSAASAQSRTAEPDSSEEQGAPAEAIAMPPPSFVPPPRTALQRECGEARAEAMALRARNGELEAEVHKLKDAAARMRAGSWRLLKSISFFNTETQKLKEEAAETR